MILDTKVALGLGHIVLDGDPALPIEKGHSAPPPLFDHVYCGQTVGHIKMKLGMEVDLDPGDVVLDGDPVPPSTRKWAHQPQFSAHVYCG